MKQKSLVSHILPILLLIGVPIVSSINCFAADTSQLMIFTAASTTNAINDIAAQFKRDTGVDVVASFASSSTLAKQIEEGAPASIFISADEDWMNYLSRKNLIDPHSRCDLLGNSLVLIAPANAKVSKITNIQSQIMSELAGGRLATGDPDHVPVGKYAKAAFKNLGIWKDVEPRLARTSDVRGALALVERGETPLGIVYSTDAAISEKVKIVGVFPPDSYPSIIYPAALVQGKTKRDAEKFFEFIKGPEAKVIFEKYGFKVK
ncbi:MAG: molybdate ABC transporter substrate-binding protein [Deltaproteobacteria bacterium]|nr:molybdate ABC transporter substrate-binding protein [Deltaproteobacteria bacterium]